MSRVLSSMVLTFACSIALSAQLARNPQFAPSGKGLGVPATGSVSVDTVHRGNGMGYHGGPIMPGTVNVYLIWYGNWTNGPKPSDSQATVDLVHSFLQGLSGSPYLMINSTYGDRQNNVTGLLNLAGSVALQQYPNGKFLSDGDVASIVRKVIAQGRLPSDTNGVYFVITTSDVNETSGFCTFFCGWHKHRPIGGADIKYAFIGNPDRCSTACEGQTTSPNGNSGGDGIANLMAYQLNEVITDPDINAWFDDASGLENGDKCVWKWGTLLGGSIGNGGYNQTIGGLNFLIQMNWENARRGGCDNFLGGPFHGN